MDTHIKVTNVSLEVPYFVQPELNTNSWFSTLVGAALAPPRRRFATLLNDVSFDVHEGDRVALIGRNGAGKTTLLRVLTGAFTPTRGHVDVQGSRQALLNMSLGFNSEATLKENIFLRATAMNIPAREVRDMVDSILEFSALRELANRRLLTLSSGQRMRLGFAISTAIQHDIMLLDEWLGAGDAWFIRRARQRMTSRVDGSKIVMLASHNQQLIQKMCNKGLVLERGNVHFYGSLKDALKSYQALSGNGGKAGAVVSVVAKGGKPPANPKSGAGGNEVTIGKHQRKGAMKVADPDSKSVVGPR